MNKISPDYGFTVTQLGDEYVFEYKKAKKSLGAGCMIVFLCFLILLCLYFFVAAFLMEPSLTKMLFLPVLPIVIVLVFIWRRKKERVPNNFSISKEYYKIKDEHYDRGHISNLCIKNTVDKRFSQDTVIVGGGLAVGMAAAGNDMGNLYRNEKRKSSFKLSFLYGSKEITLAYPLYENQAIALFNKVSQL